MDHLQKIYEHISNMSFIRFNQFFDIVFFLKKEDDHLQIYQQFQKNSDEIIIRCRRLSYDNLSFIINQQKRQDRQYILLMLSLVQSNICDIKLNGDIIAYQSLKSFLSLNCNIVRYVIHKINQSYQYVKQQNYKYEINKDFARLYNSEKGVVLQHRQISDYLTLTAFWQKLGLNYYDIKRLPFEIFKQLQLMINTEMSVKNQIIRKQTQSINKSRPNRMRGRI